MSRYRHPDPRIDDWLADGPTSLSGAATIAIKSAARTLPQRRGVTMRWPARTTRPMLIAAVAVLVAVATLAFAVGGPVWFTPDPEPSGTPVASPSADATSPAVVIGDGCFELVDVPPGGPPTGRVVLPASRVAVEYSLPPEMELTVATAEGTLSLAANRTHGVLVVDVTDAVRHGSLIEQPALGTNARTFLDELEKRFPYTGGQVIDFDVTDVNSTTLGGRPAWSAVVTWSAEHNSWTHIDRATTRDRGCALEFNVPHRLLVVDVGSSVVAVQVWAATESELTAWLAQGIELADALRIDEVPL
jgi:hypothetical protein